MNAIKNFKRKHCESIVEEKGQKVTVSFVDLKSSWAKEKNSVL